MTDSTRGLTELCIFIKSIPIPETQINHIYKNRTQFRGFLKDLYHLYKDVEVPSLRLISGRCSPDYSYGITDPHEDIQKTGTAVLGIWNERVNIATDEFSQVRTGILIRSYDLSEYVLFEENMDRYRTNEFHWKENRNGNLIGYDEHEQTRFTWQPHGSQFTIHTPVPNEAVRFKLKLPDHIITKEEALDTLKYDKSWVTIL